MKIKVLITCVLSLFLWSCDNSFEELDSVNKSPQLSFSLDQDLLKVADSVKLSTKLSIFEYSGVAYLSDEDQGVYGVKYSFENNEGEVYVEGEKLEENVPFAVSGKDKINYTVQPTSGFGKYILNLTVIDKLGAEGKGEVELIAYKNTLPAAHFTVTKLGVHSELEYQFDAKESYDRDANRGGGVVNYQYYVNDQALPLTDRSVITWYFPKKGGYRVKLKVQDNDGDWSNEVEVIVQVGG